MYACSNICSHIIMLLTIEMFIYRYVSIHENSTVQASKLNGLNLRRKESIEVGNNSMRILVHISVQHPVSSPDSPTPVVDLPVSTTTGSSVDRVTVKKFTWSYIFSAWCIWTRCQHKSLRIHDSPISILILRVDPVDLIDITCWYGHTGTCTENGTKKQQAM